MRTYKLFRVKDGKLYPLYVEAKREIPIGEWLSANVGEKADETHVKASGCGGKLALRPGFHSTTIPFTDWIGEKGKDGKLRQRVNTVWCECEVGGSEKIISDRRGSKTLVPGYYKFRTNSKQKDPWIISDNLFVKRILDHAEVKEICATYGIEAQELAA